MKWKKKALSHRKATTQLCTPTPLSSPISILCLKTCALSVHCHFGNQTPRPTPTIVFTPLPCHLHRLRQWGQGRASGGGCRSHTGLLASWEAAHPVLTQRRTCGTCRRGDSSEVSQGPALHTSYQGAASRARDLSPRSRVKSNPQSWVFLIKMKKLQAIPT